MVDLATTSRPARTS